MGEQKTKKRKFSTNQPVVFRFSERKMVGKIVSYKPIGKRFVYDVLGEDGKVYQELDVDIAANECIDTYLTKLYYKAYKIDPNSIPEVEEDMPTLSINELIEDPEESDESEADEIESSDDEDSDETDEAVVDDDMEMLFDEDDLDPNY